MEIIDLVYLDFLSKLFKLLSITKQRGLVLGLNLGHSESQTFVLFSTQYHIPGVWFSFLELRPIDIWHSLGSQRTVESKRSGTLEEGQEEKLSWARNTWGNIHVPAFMWPWGPKRHCWEQTASVRAGSRASASSLLTHSWHRRLQWPAFRSSH